MADREHIEEHLNRPGRHFEFHDRVTYIEKQEITVQTGAHFHNGPADGECVTESSDMKSLTPGPSPKGEGNSVDVLKQLKGCFFGDEEVARRFLNEVAGVKPTQVIEIVGKYIGKNEMSKLSCRRDLWKVLHENGYYEPTESNWNKAINKL